eukprot:6295591-Alexandrium_andersonii.AAC.1
MSYVPTAVASQSTPVEYDLATPERVAVPASPNGDMSVRHGPGKARTPPTINDGEARQAGGVLRPALRLSSFGGGSLCRPPRQPPCGHGRGGRGPPAASGARRR